MFQTLSFTKTFSEKSIFSGGQDYEPEGDERPSMSRSKSYN